MTCSSASACSFTGTLRTTRRSRTSTTPPPRKPLRAPSRASRRPLKSSPSATTPSTPSPLTKGRKDFGIGGAVRGSPFLFARHAKTRRFRTRLPEIGSIPVKPEIECRMGCFGPPQFICRRNGRSGSARRRAAEMWRYGNAISILLLVTRPRRAGRGDIKSLSPS